MYSSDHILAAARSWIGTRYAHQGRLKQCATHKGGVDCLGLLIGVARELKLCDEQGRLLASYDQTSYSHTPDTQQLRHLLGSLLQRKPKDALAVGDVGLFKIDDNPQHLAIIGQAQGGSLTMIHAYAQARKVSEHSMDEHWQKSLVAAYSICR